MGRPKKTVPAFRFRTVLAMLLLTLGFAAPGFAFEAVLNAPNAPKDLQKRLTNASLVFAAQREDTSDPHDIVASARAEYRRLLAVLYGEGYFGPVIKIRIDGREAANLPPFETIRAVSRVELQIDPGPQFHFGLTHLGPVTTDTDITDEFSTGQVAKTGVISRAAAQGIESWRDKGHAKARVSDQSIIADHKHDTLDVGIDLDPGPKLRFGTLHLAGNTKLSGARLRQITSLPSGETFDPEELGKIAKRLRRTGVFRSVSINEAETPGPDDTLDIEIRVEDDKPRRISFGTELESRDGLSVSAAWLHRNLFGGGERLQLDGEYSGIGSQSGNSELTFEAAFTRPATFQPDIDFGITSELHSVDNDIYKVKKLGFTIGLTKVFSDQLNISGGVLLEASNSEDDYGLRQFRTVGLPLRAVWDRRDDPLDPTHGTFINGQMMPYASTKDGAAGVRLFADARAYRALGSDRVVAAGRFQIGSILGPGIAETPPDYLFLSGGGGTVRGHLYESGFITASGNRSGGLSFIGFSGELRVKTTEAISAVAFYDAGFVGETSNFTGAGNWPAGAGLRVRYHPSIGHIRVDVAVPVSGGSTGGTQLYVGIGQAF